MIFSIQLTSAQRLEIPRLRSSASPSCLHPSPCALVALERVSTRLMQPLFTSPRRGEVGMGAPCARIPGEGAVGSPSPGSRKRDPTSPLRGEVTLTVSEHK